jgi:hypothetical protein
MAEAAFVLSWVLGVVFLASAVGKMLAFVPFANTVEAVGTMFFTSLPEVAVVAGVVAVIAIEALLAVLLLGGLLPIAAAILALAVLILFAGIGAAAMRRGAKIDCRCFGTSGETLGVRTVVRAVVLALIASILLALDARESSWRPGGGEEWISALATVAGILLLCVWLANVDIVVRLARERRHETLIQAGRITPPASSAGSET